MNESNKNASGLSEALVRFHQLWDRARKSEPWECDAMTLATVSAQGQPRARTVLLKQADESGFVFYTNYESRKGNDLATNPQAALCFFWRTLRRQITVEGTVRRLDAGVSDTYFAARPRLSQLSAWVSAQSRPLGSREELEVRMRELEVKYAGCEVPRPPYWGGFILEPDMIEFWAPDAGRLNTRERYVHDAGGGWRCEWLNP
jgi:pyridoxamine 5'-phosphate oxidase